MSDYHILAGGDDGNNYAIAMHIPIGAGNNQASVSYRTAVVQFQTNPTTGLMPKSRVPFITAPEQAQLESGELLEIVIDFRTEPNQTLLQKRAALDTLYNALVIKVQADVAKRLEFWGLNRDVP